MWGHRNCCQSIYTYIHSPRMTSFYKLSVRNYSLPRASNKYMACLVIAQLLSFGLFIYLRHRTIRIPQHALTISMESVMQSASGRQLKNESNVSMMYEKQVDFLMNNRRKNEERVLELFFEFYRIHCQEKTVAGILQQQDLKWCPCVPDKLGIIICKIEYGRKQKLTQEAISGLRRRYCSANTVTIRDNQKLKLPYKHYNFLFVII